MKLFVYTEKKTPRIDYIFHLMIEDIAGFSFQVTDNREEFEAYTGPKVAYSNAAFHNTIVIPNAFFLEGSEKEVKELNFIKHHEVECPFAVEGTGPFPFDIFSAAFYLVTRCEEYTGKIRDNHDRFPAYESVAYKKDFIEKPVVNTWALELRKKVLNKFSEITYKSRKARTVSTIDVDQLFAIRARGMKRTVGRLLKQFITLDIKSITDAFSVLLFGKEDPFYTFDYIQALNEKVKRELIFFVHLGDYDTYDKSISWNHPMMLKTIRQLSAFALVGIHPSYRSNIDSKKLGLEINRLEKIIGVKPKLSRQHYLKMTFPSTYERLIDEGIESDYTLGYSECVGFRASICTPFKFYDLKSERKTDLTVYPFAVMDRALKDEMKLSVSESIQKIKALQTEVKLNEGIFVLLFHNESLSENKEWKGWRQVYESALV